MSEPPLHVRNVHYREAAPGWAVAPHAHRSHQMYLCAYGSVDILIAGSVHHLRAEESVLVPPDVKREVRAEQRATGYLVILFDAEPVTGVQGILDRTLSLPAELRDDAHALIEEVRRPGGAESKLLVSALITRLLITLARTHRGGGGERVSPLNAGEHAKVVAQAEAFMQRNLPRPLRRAEIAAAVKLSEPHLARIFRAAIGRSVIDRLVELRMEHAQALLLESTMSVTQVASAVGITSFSYFSKKFKEATGRSPSDYRKAGGRVYS